jgi:predicted ester cyclase
METKGKQLQNNTQVSLSLISRYVSAIKNHDSGQMSELRSTNFVLDLVPGDAFDDSRRTETETKLFWPTWFSAFSEYDYQVTRTIAIDTVVVTEWCFTGINTGRLESSIFGRAVDPTNKTIRFRGVSIYEIEDDLITSESLYMDLATLWVELGIGL